MSNVLRILIADDHPVVRTGIRGMLSNQPDFEVIAEVENGQQVLDFVVQSTVDIILMDLRMPVLDGVSTIKQLKAAYPAIQILILTTYDTDHDIYAAIQAGAGGYLRKDTPLQELHRAIRTVATGGTVLTPDIASRVLNHIRESDALTEREVTILRHVARGLTNKKVGRQLHISEATVKTHLQHIYRKLGVSDRAAAVATAISRGYRLPED